METEAPEIGGQVSGHCTPIQGEAEGLSAERALWLRLWKGGEADEARALCGRMLRAVVGPEEVVGWKCNLAILHRDAGDPDSSQALLTSCENLLASATVLTRAKWHNGMGETMRLLGRLADAVRFYKLAFPLYEASPKPYLRAYPLYNIGVVQARLQDVEGTRAYLRAAALIASEAGDFKLLGRIAEEGMKL